MKISRHPCKGYQRTICSPPPSPSPPGVGIISRSCAQYCSYRDSIVFSKNLALYNNYQEDTYCTIASDIKLRGIVSRDALLEDLQNNKSTSASCLCSDGFQNVLLRRVDEQFEHNACFNFRITILISRSKILIAFGAHKN